LDSIIGRYWPFVAICAAAALFIVRLIIKEQLTLQRSLAYLMLLALLGAAALFPNVDAWLANRMGFDLVSNWFFALSIGGLSLLHLSSLVSLSRAELRTIALTQQLGILQERIDRLSAQGERP
jgi:hypothetical protein